MIGTLFALHLAAAPPWCGEAERAVRAVETADAELYPRYERALAAFPPEASAVVEASRSLAGDEASLRTATVVLRGALDHACVPPRAVDPGAARAEVSSILAADARFGGVRDEDDAIDRWLDRLFAWVTSLLESRAMQEYAGSARAVYLAALGGALGIGVWRALRGRRRGRSSGDVVAEQQREVERARARAFAAWRALATSRLDDGDARGAFYAARMALLARLGEVAAGAVTPARTHTEILGRLDDERRRSVAGPLRDFDRAFYGGAAGRANAERFLLDVDASARALDRRPP